MRKIDRVDEKLDHLVTKSTFVEGNQDALEDKVDEAVALVSEKMFKLEGKVDILIQFFEQHLDKTGNFIVLIYIS